MDNNYIGISENRLHHILGVARKAYRIAKEMDKDENFCRRMFTIGWLHDVGYEFSENQSDHPHESVKMLFSVIGTDVITQESMTAARAIENHGLCFSDMSEEQKILNMADLQIDSEGNEIDVKERIQRIKDGYGENSEQYLTVCDLAYSLGLTTTNISK